MDPNPLAWVALCASELILPAKQIAALREAFSALRTAASTLGLEWLCFSQLLAIAACWGAGKIMAHHQGRLGNALKLWGIYLLAWFGIGALTIICVSMAREEASGGLIFASIVVAILMVLATIIFFPMWIYQLPLGEACSLILIAGIVAGLGGFGAVHYFGSPIEVASWQPLLAQFTVSTSGSKRARSDVEIAADRSLTIAARKEALERIYSELEKRRVEMEPGAQSALKSYARDETRYRELLQSLRADAGSTSSQAAQLSPQ